MHTAGEKKKSNIGFSLIAQCWKMNKGFSVVGKRHPDLLWVAETEEGIRFLTLSSWSLSLSHCKREQKGTQLVMLTLR